MFSFSLRHQFRRDSCSLQWRKFVEARAVELVQALEGRLGRNLDVVARRAIERLATAESDVRPGRLDGILGGLVIDDEGLAGVRLTRPQVVEVLRPDRR